MATLTTRAGKGSALTHNELDANFKRTVSQKTTTYSIVEADNRSVIECNSATPFTVTLGAAATMAAADTGDFEVTITNIGTGAATVARAGSDTINGASTSKVLQQYESMTFKVNSAGTGYVTVAQSSNITTAGTVEAYKPIIADANKDTTGHRNITATGTATAATVAATSTMTVGGLAVQATPAAVSGYSGAGYETVYAAQPASATSFDIDGNITIDTWESVGPTGSGATNIWTALNDVPSGAKWVDVAFSTLVAKSATTTYIYIYARKTGDSSAYSLNNCVSVANVIATGASYTSTETMSVRRIPIDASNRFDLYWRGTYDTIVSSAYLVGWGV